MGTWIMHRFLALVARFGRDERGVFAVIFGLTAIVLIALGGAVVDYVSLEQTRSRAQIALDAAALALQPEIFETPLDEANIRTRARELLVDQIGDEWNVVVDDPIEVEIDVVGGSLYLRTRVTMPTMFVTLVGVDQLSAQIQSEATRRMLELEVAFVLDNSGSMTYTGAGANGTRQRIQFLKDAARCATNILFFDEVVDDPSNPDTCIPATGAEQADNVRIAVVPFTMFVNVGASNAGATWIDTNGASVIANDNFDTDDDETTLPGTPPASAVPSRSSLFAATGEAWRGCVEARPHIKTGSLATEYLDTDDSLPAGTNTLYVPMFSPDLISGIGNNSYMTNDSPAVCDRPATSPSVTTCTVQKRRTGCNSGMSNSSCTTTQLSGVPSGPTGFTSSALYANAYYGAHPTLCDCRNASPVWTQTAGNGNNRTFLSNFYTCTGGGYIPMGLSNRELQERICKYHQPINNSSFSTGPNADCTRTAILPLSDTPATVNSAITSMTAEGGTNIHEGTVWGYRVLTPTLPFDQGNNFDTSTSKVMIIMTDGENTAYNLDTHCGSTQRSLNGSCYNSAYGYPYNSKNSSTTSSSSGTIERLGPVASVNGSVASTNATLVTEMNTRTAQTCENAKAAGINVYVIGLATSQASQSTQAVVEAMLRQCASTTDQAYFPQTPGELKSVFEDIADDLSALRLAL